MLAQKKNIIAVFLLFIYSIGFSIELVPHCHLDAHVNHASIDHEEKDNHGNHKHVSLENQDDDDIYHRNHLDDNILDFVVCLLSEIEHAESDFQHQIVLTDSNLNLNKTSQVKIIAILSSLYSIQTPEKKTKILPIDISTKLITEISSSPPLRGPPYFSC